MLKRARERKLNKPEYNYLISDFKVIGWSPSYDTIEVGSLDTCHHLLWKPFGFILYLSNKVFFPLH